MEEKLDQHNVQLAQVQKFISYRTPILIPLKVTRTKGFEILGERALQEVIEQM